MARITSFRQIRWRSRIPWQPQACSVHPPSGCLQIDTRIHPCFCSKPISLEKIFTHPLPPQKNKKPFFKATQRFLNMSNFVGEREPESSEEQWKRCEDISAVMRHIHATHQAGVCSLGVSVNPMLKVSSPGKRPQGVGTCIRPEPTLEGREKAQRTPP